jgi:hypothetical protein
VTLEQREQLALKVSKVTLEPLALKDFKGKSEPLALRESRVLKVTPEPPEQRGHKD